MNNDERFAQFCATELTNNEVWALVWAMDTFEKRQVSSEEWKNAQATVRMLRQALTRRLGVVE